MELTLLIDSSIKLMGYIWLLMGYIYYKVVKLMNSRIEGWSTDRCMHACNV